MRLQAVVLWCATVVAAATAPEYGAVSGAEAVATRRGLRAARAQQEERLIGWLGETYHAETKSKEIHRLADEEKARGAWVEQLSWRPRAYLYHSFMTPEECDHIVAVAKKTVVRSTVVDSETGEVKTDPIRTSSQTFLKRGHDKVTQGVEERLARWAMIPVENGEDMQVLRYELGQKYDAHHDVGELDSKSGQQLAADGGFRAATALLYLSDVEEGGETVFPYSEWIDDTKATETTYSECGSMGVAAKPKKGDVLLFWSVTLEGKIDPASMHAGCPVIRGTKWTGTKWLHQRPFRWTAPPKPGIPEGCEDQHINCPAWAASGECKNNPLYMLGDPGRKNGQCMWACKSCKGHV